MLYPHAAFRLLLICATALLAASCGNRPDGVLDKEKMARLMADIHMGESVVETNSSTFGNDSVKRAFRQAIYARHGLTPEMADSSLRWYGYHMEKYLEVCDLTVEILEKRLEEEQERGGSSASVGIRGGSLPMEGDSVDVWYETRHRPFSRILPTELITFYYTFDSNWERGDVYTFKAKLTGTVRPAQLAIGVDYSDGHSETYSTKFIGDGWHEASFALDSLRSAREIVGSFRYSPASGETMFADSISLTRTRLAPHNRTVRRNMNSLDSKRHSKRYD